MPRKIDPLDAVLRILKQPRPVSPRRMPHKGFGSAGALRVMTGLANVYPRAVTIRDDDHRAHAEALHASGNIRCVISGNGLSCALTARGKERAIEAGLMRETV